MYKVVIYDKSQSYPLLKSDGTIELFYFPHTRVNCKDLETGESVVSKMHLEPNNEAHLVLIDEDKIQRIQSRASRTANMTL